MRKQTYIIIVLFLLGIFCAFAEQPALIAIDAPHGGNDTGYVRTYTENGQEKKVCEKDMALNVAQKVYTLLKQKNPNMPIMLIRKDDTFFSFEERYAKVRLHDAKPRPLFISISHNISRDSSRNGFTIYVPSLSKNRKGNTALSRSLSEGLEATIGTQMKNCGITSYETKANQADVIIEVGYLTNDADLALLLDDGFLSYCAEGIVTGIKNYIDSLS